MPRAKIQFLLFAGAVRIEFLIKNLLKKRGGNPQIKTILPFGKIRVLLSVDFVKSYISVRKQRQKMKIRDATTFGKLIHNARKKRC